MYRFVALLSAIMMVTVMQSQLTLDATAYSTRCAGSSTGLVEITSTGAIGAVSLLTNLDLTQMAAGTYTIIGEDESGQQASVSFVILDHPASCGCTYPTAFNFEVDAEVDNGSCVFSSDQSCLADIVPDGVVGTNDLLQLLVEFGVICGE